MFSKMIQLPMMVVIALAPATGALKIDTCAVGAVDAAWNPYDGDTACGRPASVSSNLADICGSTVSEGLSIFAKMCKLKGTPITYGYGDGKPTTHIPAMITITTVITTAITEKAHPAPMTTVVVPVETRTYVVSIGPVKATNGSSGHSAYPTAPVVGGSGVNTTTTAVTSPASVRTQTTTSTKHGSGLVVEANSVPLTTTASATPAAASITSSALAALLATGDASYLVLALGAGLIAAW